MSEPALQVDSVSVRFGDWIAIDGINFALPSGAFMTIVGPNGAGKTTLLRCILGLIAPTVGRVLVFGKPPLDCPAGWMGYVPQVKTLDRSFPARAVELVATGMLGSWPARLDRASRDQAMTALEQVKMEGVADRSIAKLSGGELQRVYLARALVREPRLIALDEPAAGMDVTGEADMYAVLEQYQQRTGATVVMITHDWDASHHHSSHVLVMVRHQVAFGPPEEALRESVLGKAFGHGRHKH
ncbi:metal ABC transporter ATP-binding protein [bacterium]|nr:metal ABC transporter ATP-binding protein [bacterium]